ncbi:FCD domain-containing protein [Pseudarthrobacter sp. AG30]|uniref:GntR family transcriptional regulator n=1 Tax=Pseudarthrobacter sp. AG30 TaxID=2249742 RepID=UPI000D6E3B18|nr:GntR family transcriptional regulator [Pseudarthrobacter sp. AG30]RAX14906.1 FCD domain-containing protein [Pseudarthrobacter sp. AG30]
MIAARSSQVVSRLQQEILDGTFPPDSPLREMTLAERYAVSRRTIREALLVLSDQGLAVHRHNTGAVVRSFGEDDISDLYRVRRMLECEGARCSSGAAEYLLAAVQEAFGKLELASHEGVWSVDLARADMAFHGAVIALSDSPRINEFYGRIGSQMTFAITLLQQSEQANAINSHSIVAEHRAILDAVLNRDVYGAQRLILEHIATHEGTLLSLVTASGRRGRSATRSGEQEPAAVGAGLYA